MIPVVKSLYAAPRPESDETIDEILAGASFRLEHIVSHGKSSPDGSWYEQDRDEWVALIRGRSVLEFEEGRLELQAGDSLLIPAQLRHRVAGASEDAVWVALHFLETYKKISQGK